MTAPISSPQRSDLRVLTFLHSFEPGGVERVALRLVRCWRQMGVDTPLFMGRDAGALRSELADGLKYKLPKFRISVGWFETLWMIWNLPEAILSTEPDVLFCAGNTYTIVALAMKVILRGRCPPIVAKISNDLLRPGLAPVPATLFRLWARVQSLVIDRWVVMHPSMVPEVTRLGGSGRVDVVPDPALNLDQILLLQAWTPPARTRSGRRFVAIGRLVEQKNYPLMLRAFAAASFSADCLTIFGEGPMRRRLERLAEHLGLQDRVCFAGHTRNAASCLLHQDALLLSSDYEGVPAVLLEAMACGMPIAATNCGPGVQHLLAEYPNAITSPAGDFGAFSDAIWQLSSVPPSKQTGSFDANTYVLEAGSAAYLESFLKVARSSTAAPMCAVNLTGGAHEVSQPHSASTTYGGLSTETSSGAEKLSGTSG